MIGTFEEQWLAQGKAKGVEEGLRGAIMRLIAKRFGGSLAQSAAPSVQAIGSIDALNEILDLAAVDATADRLLDKLDQDRPAPA